MFSVAGKELRILFVSPLAWSVMAIVQALVAFLFLSYLEEYLLSLPELLEMTNPPGISLYVVRQLFAAFAFILLFVAPLITMRLISEEQRNRTLILLNSAPLSTTEIVLGKFAGAMGFLFILLLLVVLMPLSLLAVGNLDIGILLSGILGLSLLMCGITAIGLYISSLTQQPTIAAVSTFGVLLLLWIIDTANKIGTPDPVMNYVSMMNHYQYLLRGIFTSTDVIYFLLVTAIFLVLTIRRLDAQRLQQ